MNRGKFVSVLLVVLVACGGENALVGGRCKDGFEVIDGRCAETPVTPHGGTLPPSETPTKTVNGTYAGTVGRVDAGGTTPTDDGGMDDGGTTETDAGIADASPPDSATPDSATPDASPDAPLVCSAERLACHGVCIDVANDAANCGACGKVCPSNICVAGECQGATPGDVVLVGHDFVPTWSGSAQAKVLVNAASIPTTDPIRVLAYTTSASPWGVNQVHSLISGGVVPRKVDFTVGDEAALASPTLAKSYDVVIVHDVAPSDPAALGGQWTTSLGRFAEKGGVVIAIDSGAASMPALISATGLLAVGGHAPVPAGTHLEVTAPSDSVGVQVLSPYAGPGSSVSFFGITYGPDVTAVVRAKPGGVLGDAVVVHRIVR